VEFVLYLALGVAGGLVSAAFSRLLLSLRERFLRLPRETLWIQPVVGGVLVGVMGWFVPQVMGVGYKHIDEVLNGSMALKLMLLLLVLKLVAMAVSYASGNAGGIFGPSLFLGAMLGGIIGTVGHQLLPGYTATPGAYALVGMGAAFAGVVRAPMTSVVMIFEITRDYAVIVPLMISSLVSYFIASRLQREPIYEVLARQDGIHLPTAASRKLEEKRQVSQALREPPQVLRADMTANEALGHVRASPLQAWPVLGQPGVIGIVSAHQLREAAAEGTATAKRLQDLVEPTNFPHLHPDHSLNTALERMGGTHLDVLPVVSRANVHQLEGIVTLADVLALYGVSPKEPV
jgi:CIC family chloride channel protein